MLATEGYGIRPDPDETFVRNNQERYLSGRRATVGLQNIQFTDGPLGSPKASIHSLVSPLSAKRGGSKNKFSPIPSKMYLREQRHLHLKQNKYSFNTLSSTKNYSQNPTFAQNEPNQIQIKPMDEIEDPIQN